MTKKTKSPQRENKQKAYALNCVPANSLSPALTMQKVN